MAKKISKERFNIYAIGTRLSTTRLIGEELSWWSDLDEDVIGTVIMDYHDKDFSWMLLARDEKGRFRGADFECSLSSEKKAEAKLRIKIANTVRDQDFEGIVKQGDDLSSSLDLLKPITKEYHKLHPYFRHLIESDSAMPARAVFKEIGPALHLHDEHFLNEFQLYQFDQRLWELYLWASLREQGYDVHQREAPDFECHSATTNLRFTLEATTVAPSQSGVLADHPNPKSDKEIDKFLKTYMPMKFGGALTSKLKHVNRKGQRYWERDHSKEKPFVIGVSDFHKESNAQTGEPTSIIYSQGALYIYLYGNRIDWFLNNEKKLILTMAKVDSHSYKTKNIPSGFFDLPDAENISGVLFSNAGTLPKFERMGVCAGFIPPNHKYFRLGCRFDPDSDAFMGLPFCEEVGVGEYKENWSDELQFFHNPNAKYPIDPNDFPDIAHHNLIDGKLLTIDKGNRVISSMTQVLHYKKK